MYQRLTRFQMAERHFKLVVSVQDHVCELFQVVCSYVSLERLLAAADLLE